MSERQREEVPKTITSQDKEHLRAEGSRLYRVLAAWAAKLREEQVAKGEGDAKS